MYKTDSLGEFTGKDALLTPTGFRILIAMPSVEEKTKGGVLIPDELKDREAVASIVGCVVAMGPDAYKDKKRFPNGAYCKVGDWVIFRSYSGTKVKLENGQEVRFINDDTVDGVVSDPRKVKRA